MPLKVIVVKTARGIIGYFKVKRVGYLFIGVKNVRLLDIVKNTMNRESIIIFFQKQNSRPYPRDGHLGFKRVDERKDRAKKRRVDKKLDKPKRDEDEDDE